MNLVKLGDKEYLRGKLFFNIFKRSIIFDTLDAANAYRKHLIDRKLQIPFLYTRDGHRIQVLLSQLNPELSQINPDISFLPCCHNLTRNCRNLTRNYHFFRMQPDGVRDPGKGRSSAPKDLEFIFGQQSNQSQAEYKAVCRYVCESVTTSPEPAPGPVTT